MNSRILLLGIAIVAVGLFALPQTMALFIGQHDWYDTKPEGIQIPCLKCHADIANELNQGAAGTTNSFHRAQAGPNPDGTGGCYACHVTVAPALENPPLTQGGPLGSGFHAAAAPMCLDCHGGLGTGGAVGPGTDARSILNSPEEVHRPFAAQAALGTAQLMKGANEACIACHTHVPAKVTWTKPTTIEFSASEASAAPDAAKVWTVSGFSATGSASYVTAPTGTPYPTYTPPP